MKRLQVGDECYVRDGRTKEIFRCLYGIDCDGIPNPAHAKLIGIGCSYHINTETTPHRLVYPYPVIKQLAK